MNVEPYCRCPGCGECDAHRKARKQPPPLNLNDKAVQKRLAEQWGYVPKGTKP
jgi:hypothetical protein